MALSADLLRGYTDSIILRRLHDGESYGYRINREVSEMSDGAFEPKEATLYTAFRRLEGFLSPGEFIPCLEEAGLIRSRWGDEESGARRRYYRTTEKGEDRLTADIAGWRETRALLDLLLKEEST